MEAAKAFLISSVDFALFIRTLGEKRATSGGGMQSGPRAGQTLKRIEAVQCSFPLHSAVHQKASYAFASVTRPSSKPPIWPCKYVLDFIRMPFPPDFLPYHRAKNQPQRPVGEMPSRRALASPQAA